VRLTLGILIAFVVAFVAVSLFWRTASRRWSIPCPSLLSWWFEGSLVDWVAGTNRTLERMRLIPGQTILEVGPGPGRLLIPAAFRVLPGGQAIGIDLQPKMIQRLETRARQAGVPNLSACVGDATKLDLPEGSIDLAYLCTVLGEIPDRSAALVECRRVLKPGGILAITEIIGDPHYQTRAKVRQLAESSGFRPETCEGNFRLYTARFRKP